MKEISEINKKINLGTSGAAAVARPAERALPPGMQRVEPGFDLSNELAPHLRGQT